VPPYIVPKLNAVIMLTAPCSNQFISAIFDYSDVEQPEVIRQAVDI
jgi:hypothetical protein